MFLAPAWADFLAPVWVELLFLVVEYLAPEEERYLYREAYQVHQATYPYQELEYLEAYVLAGTGAWGQRALEDRSGPEA